MDVLTVIGIIVLIIFAFVFLGLAGWVLKGLGVVFNFLWEGCSTSIGCLFWVVFAFFVLMTLLI